MLIMWFFYIYFTILFLYSIAMLIRLAFFTNDQATRIPNQDVPSISILIAARNEEHNIGKCLEAIQRLQYPFDKIEILIGDDESSDNTAAIISTFAHHDVRIKLVSIIPSQTSVKGKANVLAQLAKQAKGSFYFITDADIQVPTNWINSLLDHFSEKTGIVSGCTNASPKNLLGKAQQLDWIFAFGMVKIVSDLKLPVSAVGNNMAIRSSAYWDTGGYEKIPFSVTEDQELFLQTINKGWEFKNLMNAECLAITEPIHTWKELFKQRRRWMSGAMKLPKILVACLFLQGIAFPMLLALLFFSPILGIFVWATKWILQQVFLWQCFRKLNLKYSIIRHAFLFELYTSFFAPLVVMNYWFTKKIEWKGRTY